MRKHLTSIYSTGIPAGASRLIAVAAAAVVLVSVGSTLACNDVKTGGESSSLAKTEEYVPGEIVVWFDDGTSEAEIDTAVAAAGGEIVRRSGVTPTRVTVSVPEGEEDDYVAAYRKLENVKVAERNTVVRTFPGETAPETGGGGLKGKIGE